jgi:hypothetical protein
MPVLLDDEAERLESTLSPTRRSPNFRWVPGKIVSRAVARLWCSGLHARRHRQTSQAAHVATPRIGQGEGHRDFAALQAG